MHFHGREKVCQPGQQCDSLMCLGFGQQWSFMTQRNKIDQALATQTILDNRIVGSGLSMEFVDNNKNIE